MLNILKLIFIRSISSTTARTIFICIIISSQLLAQDYSREKELIKGVDISTLLEIEDNGGIFKENGNPKDALEIFRGHGINYIRLRVWHTPGSGYCDLTKTLSMANRIKDLGLKLLLDFHYSDTWADPAHQTKPAAWQNLSFQELKDSIYFYTSNFVTALKNQGTLPDIVQIGNEITCGMLWNEGRVCDQFNTPQQWAQLGELINEGIRGVNESLNAGDTVKIMIHIDRGGDNASSQWFFDNLLEENVNFDIMVYLTIPGGKGH
jgi:arabinogalactan endo-1,4-beta-galactosidase